MLIFTEAPGFDLQDNEKEIFVVEPHPFCILVPISGLPAPTVSWVRMRDSYCFNDDQDRIKTEQRSTYAKMSVSQSVRKLDTGTYKLLLRNDLGSAECVFTVIVCGESSVFL